MDCLEHCPGLWDGSMKSRCSTAAITTPSIGGSGGATIRTPVCFAQWVILSIAGSALTTELCHAGPKRLQLAADAPRRWHQRMGLTMRVSYGCPTVTPERKRNERITRDFDEARSGAAVSSNRWLCLGGNKSRNCRSNPMLSARRGDGIQRRASRTRLQKPMPALQDSFYACLAHNATRQELPALEA